MRVLIRQRGGARYLADQEHWVSARNEALDFVTSVFALDAAERMKLKGIEIVLEFDGVGSEVVLNVPDDSKNPPKRS